ncbi:MAG: LPS export ABC transporter permease LptF [Thiobacillaceae bacterium]|nr:LPS export ABC transporter permease LptF [Thiobacillaceae bacterium]MDW8322563.1 LPS export ABC transporter permease LptF [Burkholderiales bacterium]
MRLFNSALIREMSSLGGVALAALTGIVLVTLMVRLLGRAAVGRIDEAAVFPFIGFGVLHALPMLLALSLFMAVFLTLSRLWHDSEMVIWQGAGVGPLRWLSPVLRLALPVAALIAALSLYLIPWVAQKRTDYERWLQSQDEIAAIDAGVFVESGGGRRVFFVESYDAASGRVRNVFLQSVENARPGVIVAREGQVAVNEQGDRFLVLTQGRRYEGEPGAADYRMVQFERYTVRLEAPAFAAVVRTPRSTPTAELLSDPTPFNQAEWVTRIGHPISAVLLAIFAIPASATNARAGRSYNILFALLVYVAYSNLMGLTEAWVGQQKLTAAAGVMAVHGGMLLLTALLYWRMGRGGRWGWR